MLRFVGGAAVLVVASLTHATVFFGSFFGTCSISDTASTVPAPGSWQGRACEAAFDSGFYAAVAVMGCSTLLAVVLAVRRWASERWQNLGITACLWLPLLLFVAFRVPPDACTEEQRRELPSYACERTGNS